MQEQKTQISVVMLIIILAIILGAFVFIVFLVIQGRPMPANTAVLVGDQTVNLSVDPNNRVEVIGEIVTEPVVEPVPEEPVVEEVPAEPVAEEETVVLEEATAVPQPEPTAVPVQETQGVGGVVGNMYIFSQHTVQASDTLYSLAKQYNTTIPLLARFGTATLVPGQSVTITQANPSYCPNSRWYIAREGDTPGGLAATYGTTLDVLDQLNGWQGNYSVLETAVICVP